MGLRHAHGAEAGRPQPGNRLMGQDALALARQCALGDARKHRIEALRQRRIGRRAELRRRIGGKDSLSIHGELQR